MNKKNSLNYKDAGVDIDAGNKFINQIKDLTKKTTRPEVIGGLGGFGALCSIPKKYIEPILVSATDGVGTKLRLAMDLNRHDTIGIDLVAMCVNDLIVQGAEPLFFLDYFATGKLNTNIAKNVITGIIEGCVQSNCTLVGGETAEMPGMYKDEDYDLAGFCIGVVERKDIIDGSKAEVGDNLIALGSSGPHSNGYSLIHKILDKNKTDPKKILLKEKLLADWLLEPTKIYVKSIRKLISYAKVNIHAIAHLTGGGFLENIPRVLPEFTQAVIEETSWKWPEIFQWLQKEGEVSRKDMYHTFNCGVGMVIALPASETDDAISILNSEDEKAWKIGYIALLPDAKSTERVIIHQ